MREEIILFIDKDGKISCKGHTNFIAQGRFSVYWEGFVYGYGQVAGKDSIKAFIQAIEDRGICEARKDIAGSYAIAVNDGVTKEWLAFSDPRRSLPWYSDGVMLSTSFIDLAKAKNYTVKDLSPEAVVEFFLTGLQFGQEILFYGIEVAEPYELIRWRDGRLYIEKDEKVLDPFQLSAPSDPIKKFLEAWRRFAVAIHKETVSVDLTGGTDSRVIVGVLDSLGVQFETAVSGTAVHSDVLISKRVAASLGNSHPHHPCIHCVRPKRLWKELYQIVRAVDGVTDGVSAHRLYQLYNNRVSRGMSLVIGGSGGELYKDGGWWRAAALLGPGPDPGGRLIWRLVQNGLIGWGLEAKSPNDIFNPALRDIANNYKTRLFATLRNKYADKFSEGVYRLADRLFFEYSVRAPRGFGARILPSYHPLLDVYWVYVGINLKWNQRFLHRFYRRILGQVNPQLAKIPTNRGGMTLQPGRELIELLGGLKILEKSRQERVASKDDPLLFETLRQIPEVDQAVDDLKAWKIVVDDLSIAKIPDKYLGRLITLWITLDLIQGGIETS